MYFLIGGVILLAGAALLVIMMLGKHEQDLGTISQGWIAQHRSSHELDR